MDFMPQAVPPAEVKGLRSGFGLLDRVLWMVLSVNDKNVDE